MGVDRGVFNGIPCLWLQNDALRLALALERGLRVLAFSPAGGENLFAELGQLETGMPEHPYPLLGGHRLWHAPEWAPRTYWPETSPFEVQSAGDWAAVSIPADRSGIARSMRVALDGAHPRLEVTHTLTNHGLWSVELAAWAITQLPTGGVVLCPQSTDLVGGNIATPNRAWVLWPFTDIHDERLRLGNRAALFHARPGKPAKIGCLNLSGLLAYWRQGWIFARRFDPAPHQPHTDLNANAQVYLCEDFVEIETLGPLVRLPPGDSVNHVETWTVLPAPAEPTSEDDAQSLLDHAAQLLDREGGMP